MVARGSLIGGHLPALSHTCEPIGTDNRVAEALAGLKGVAKVEVRLRDGKVGIHYDAELVQPSALSEALAEAGYESTPNVAA